MSMAGPMGPVVVIDGDALRNGAWRKERSAFVTPPADRIEEGLQPSLGIDSRDLGKPAFSRTWAPGSNCQTTWRVSPRRPRPRGEGHQIAARWTSQPRRPGTSHFAHGPIDGGDFDELTRFGNGDHRYGLEVFSCFDVGIFPFFMIHR